MDQRQAQELNLLAGRDRIMASFVEDRDVLSRIADTESCLWSDMDKLYIRCTLLGVVSLVFTNNVIGSEL